MTIRYAFRICIKDNNKYCKAWNGKGDMAANLLPNGLCTRDSAKDCKFLVETKPIVLQQNKS